MTNEMILRSGESLVEFSRRFPDWKFDSGESWTAYQARIHQDGTFRQDGGDDEEGPALSANAERNAMIKRQREASGVTRPADPAEPDADAARKAMIKQKVDGWKTPKKKPEGPKPPKSASEKKAAQEGEDEPGEESEEEDDAFDAVAKAKAASDARKRGGKR